MELVRGAGRLLGEEAVAWRQDPGNFSGGERFVPVEDQVEGPVPEREAVPRTVTLECVVDRSRGLDDRDGAARASRRAATALSPSPT